MDLLQTVRKEGSRGGRGEFKWDDVKSSTRRENYLGHSLMAPVGRWQQNRDLSWYAKSNDPDAPADEVTAAENARKEELARVKRTEEDAMAAALGQPVPVRDGDNANETPLGERPGQTEASDRNLREERRDDRKRHRRRSRERSSRRERRKDRSRSRDRDRDRDRDRRRRHRDDSRDRERARERDSHRRRERRGYSADRDGARYQSRRDDGDRSDRREKDEYRSRRHS